MNLVKFRKVGTTSKGGVAIHVRQSMRGSAHPKNQPRRATLRATTRLMLKRGYIRARKRRQPDPDHNAIAHLLAHRTHKPWRVNQRAVQPNRAARRHALRRAGA